MTTTIPESDLEYRRSGLLGKVERMLDEAEKAGRGISPAEQVEINGHHAEIRAIDHSRSEAAARSSRPAGPGPVVPVIPSFAAARGGVYTPESRDSYFRDLFHSTRGDSNAADRLSRHSREFHDYVVSSDDRELRAISTTAGGAGEFAPPMYLLDQYIAALRPGRATADACTTLQLPMGADVLNIPKIATGTTTAIQGTQNTQISQTDITTTTVPATVYTIAGGQLVSQQLLDQSPISGSIDQVILQDLLADYQKQSGTLVLNGTGSGQPLGLFNAVANAVTYTDASPAFVGAGKLYAKIAQAVQTVQTARYAGPTAIVMHPRRWAWITVQVDSQNRPVVVPGDSGPTNANGVQTTGAAQGIVGRMFGLPVIVDPNITTTIGAGNNQDQILVGKLDDSWLYEGSINAQAFEQTYANTISVYCRLYRYIALGHRTPQSLVAITGTGLVAPTF